MKIFRKFICAIIVIVLAMAFAGCGDDTLQLATPQNVTANNEGVITWNAVENAEYYVLVHNGHNYNIGNITSYKVGSTVNDFTYAVYAGANGYKNSSPSATQTFKGKGVPIIVDPLIEGLTVSVKGNQLVGSGRETSLTATINYPDGNTGKSVVWSIVDGGDYAEIDGNGKFTAKEVTEDHDVTVRATSAENKDKYAELVICVACQPTLTDAMLDELKDNYVSFEGYMDIDLYNFEIFERFVRTVSVYGISTQMNGNIWHASYVDGNSGYSADIHYRNVDGEAQQVALSLMNDEEYYPMTDEKGNTVSWTDAGLYNNFKTLSASDFEFNEKDWRYYYKGGDDDLSQKMVASATPYEFDPARFGLIIDGGDILGIYAESKPSYTVVQGYKSIQKLYSYVNCGEENVEVPVISKFEHNPATTDGGHIDHDILDAAIENMRNLKSYTVDFTLSSHMATGYTIGGFIETVVEDDCYFQPYDMQIINGTEYKTMREDTQYGYHKIDDDTYNSYNYDPETGKNIAARSFDGDMSNAKASFAFASEIFTAWGSATVGGRQAYIYEVNESMCNVASTFYFGVGNDMPLYGLFAMRYDMLADYTPYLVVQDGYIIEAGFFYFLGDMYGEVRIHYTDFNAAQLPEDLSFEGFVPRSAPASWSQLTVIDQTLYGNEEEINAHQYFTKLFGSETVANALPFFGEILGDTFGFALASYRAPGGMSNQVETVILYYDVPLDSDRSIDSSIKSVQIFLENNGFEKNAHGEYVNGMISALPYDSSLDFIIYIWKTV